jgi:hypothetical protein
MTTAVTSHPVSTAPGPAKWKLWTGRALSALPIAAMVLSATGKLSHAPGVVEQMTAKFGYPERLMTPIGLLEVLCAVLYAVPRTAVLGAVLVTGYLGGAIATHVRVEDPAFAMPFLLGVIAWGGLYLRDPRVSAILPLRSK